MEYKLETDYDFGFDLFNRLRRELNDFRIRVSMSGEKDNGATLTRVYYFSGDEKINLTVIHGSSDGGDVFTISRNGNNSLILNCDDKSLVEKIKNSV